MQPILGQLEEQAGRDRKVHSILSFLGEQAAQNKKAGQDKWPQEAECLTLLKQPEPSALQERMASAALSESPSDFRMEANMCQLKEAPLSALSG
eukprot:351380-Pelagomonas_calceolata.AAC.2